MASRLLLPGALSALLALAALPAPARATDPALRAARALARRMSVTPNHRGAVALGTWREVPSAVWSVREERACLDALGAAVVPARPQSFTPTEIPTAVEITGPVGGVTFEKSRSTRLIVACELAARLPALATVLRTHRVRRAIVMSAYRREPRASFHAWGLGLDLSAFELDDGSVVTVLDHYEPTPDHETCAAPPASTAEARLLRALACDIALTTAFSTVLTPSYPGHENHFHLDVRPDDPRFFVR